METKIRKMRRKENLKLEKALPRSQERRSLVGQILAVSKELVPFTILIKTSLKFSSFSGR